MKKTGLHFINLTPTVIINIELQILGYHLEGYIYAKNIGFRSQKLFLTRPVMQGRRFVVNKQQLRSGLKLERFCSQN